MILTIKEYKEIINTIEKDYKKVTDIHQQYKSNLKKCSTDEIIVFNFQSNTSVTDLRNDFDYFERWYSKFFKQLKWRIDKYDGVLGDYEDVEDAYNYRNAINENVYLLINFINDQINFINPVIIDDGLIDINGYIKILDNLIIDFKKLI